MFIENYQARYACTYRFRDAASCSYLKHADFYPILFDS